MVRFVYFNNAPNSSFQSLCPMSKRFSVFQLRCAPIPHVRIGLIGLGFRGLQTLERYAFVEGASILALADLRAEAVERGQVALQDSHRATVQLFSGEGAWQELCHLPNLDLIYICTDWESHCEIATYAMRCGKHVAVEVPAATSVAQCWDLVRTAEETQRHCFMTENCCYDWFALATLDLQHREQFFGTITHCEGAYIHDWRSMFAQSEQQHRAWYSRSCLHGGNPYPTHGIGPIAQLLGFHRGDRMCSLVSLTGQAVGADSELGRINSTLIRTARGVSILLQFDGTTPRPYSRLQTICGTDAFAQKYPQVAVQRNDDLLEAQAAEDFLQQNSQSPAAQLWREGLAKGSPNPMNYAMDARLIHCLRHGQALDIDVYDAAEWSCLAELSRLSASLGGMPVEIPDFLCGDAPC